MSVQVAAFHASFGDLSALLAGLQLPSLRRAVLSETGARIGRSSRLSRLDEQLGWALRQILPGSAEPDCLRNAVNPFFYRAPETLPPSGPSSSLTAEPGGQSAAGETHGAGRRREPHAPALAQRRRVRVRGPGALRRGPGRGTTVRRGLCGRGSRLADGSGAYAGGPALRRVLVQARACRPRRARACRDARRPPVRPQDP